MEKSLFDNLSPEQQRKFEDLVARSIKNDHMDAVNLALKIFYDKDKKTVVSAVKDLNQKIAKMESPTT